MFHKTLAALTIVLALTAPAFAANQTGVVVDAKNKVIGAWSLGDRVMVEVKGTWFLLPVANSGFVEQQWGTFYIEPDCAGQVYWPARTGMEVVPGIHDGAMYYPSTDAQELPLGSWSDGRGTCYNQPPGTESQMLAPEETMPLSELGFKAPFHLR